MGGRLLPAVEPNFDDLCPDLVPREHISWSAPKDDPRPSHRLGVHQTLGSTSDSKAIWVNVYSGCQRITIIAVDALLLVRISVLMSNHHLEVATIFLLTRRLCRIRVVQ